MIELGKCPKCLKSIDEGHANSYCTSCGEQLPRDIQERLPRLVALRTTAAAEGYVEAAQVQSSSPVVNRYRDAYRVARALVGLGNGIKIVGAFLGGIILLGSLLLLANDQFGSGGLVLTGMLTAVVVGVLFWVSGVIVVAQGEIVRATLDTAVASSHFLSDPERADAMGLPRSVADRSNT